MGTSYTRSVKTGNGQRTIRRTSASGKTTTTVVNRTKLGSGDWMTTRMTGSPSVKSPKPTRSSSRNRSFRSSRSRGDGGTTLMLGLFVAIIAGISWLFSLIFGRNEDHDEQIEQNTE